MLAESELGRHEDVIPLAGSLEPFANEFLVVLIAIGGIPEHLAQVVRFVENFEAFGIGLRLAVVVGGKAHGSEAECGDVRTLRICEVSIIERFTATLELWDRARCLAMNEALL